MKIRTALLTAALVFTGAPLALSAQNLLPNPSFEDLFSGSGDNVDLDLFSSGTGQLDGWGLNGSGASGGTNVVTAAAGVGSPFDGTRFINLGGGSANPGKGIFTTFVGVLGQTYEVSVYARYFGSGEGVRGRVMVDNGDGEVFSLYLSQSAITGESTLTDAWTAHTFQFVATSDGTHGLRLLDATPAGTSPNTDLQYDFARVTTVAIPEPASAALLAGLGLFACAATRRRR